MDAQSYVQALANLGWNHVKAAAMFGVSERTAWRYSQVGAPGPVARLITIYTLRPDTQQLADAKLASSAPQQSRRGPLGHPLLALVPSDSWSRVFKKKEEQRPLADIAWKRFLDVKRDAPRERTFAEIWDEATAGLAERYCLYRPSVQLALARECLAKMRRPFPDEAANSPAGESTGETEEEFLARRARELGMTQ
jgi:hypothetical protein